VETVWLQRLHVLFFLEIGSRCVHPGCTASPTGAWVVQQARQLAWLQDRKTQARFLLRDRDSGQQPLQLQRSRSDLPTLFAD
jgi:putative transposase